jgi:hypothetical protein
MGGNGIVCKGKTVDQAIEKGLDQLGVSRNLVGVEILDPGKKGLLNFRSKPAVVKLFLLENEEVSIDFQNKTNQIEERQFSLELVVKNGTLSLTDKRDGQALIFLPPEIKFYKNGSLINEGKTVITARDTYQIEFNDEEIETKWEIDVNEPSTEATLSVWPGEKIHMSLTDHPPAAQLFLKVKKEVEPNLTLSPHGIKTEMNRLGIVNGIDYEAIDQACSSMEAANFTIAKGVPPKDGIDGWIEFHCQIEEDTRFEEREDGTIDFKNKRSIPSIAEGTVIGTVHPPVNGEPGKSVTGEEIAPKPGLPLHVVVGKGVQFDESTQTIISETSGRPTVAKHGKSLKVEVMPKLHHNGNVSLESGNLQFNGDIEISGDIEDGMTVKSTGDIEVRGTVSNANVFAGKSAAFYANIIGSTISAGYSNRVLVEKADLLDKVLEHLQLLIASVKQVVQNQPMSMESNETNRIMPIVKLLIEKKFDSFTKLIRRLDAELKEEQDMFDDEWITLSHQLFRVFIMMDSNAIRHLNDLIQLENELRALIEMTKTPLNDEMNISFLTAMNSEIYCSGDVILVQKGCYNTTIYAGGFAKIGGFVRGGQVFGKKGAKIREVGSRGGVPTLIKVPEDSSIQLTAAMADTALQIGHQKYQLTNDHHFIKASLGKDGRIEITKCGG